MITAKDLIILLNSIPEDTKVTYDSGYGQFFSEEFEYMERDGIVILNGSLWDENSLENAKNDTTLKNK